MAQAVLVARAAVIVHLLAGAMRLYQVLLRCALTLALVALWQDDQLVLRNMHANAPVQSMGARMFCIVHHEVCAYYGVKSESLHLDITEYLDHYSKLIVAYRWRAYVAHMVAMVILVFVYMLPADISFRQHPCQSLSVVALTAVGCGSLLGAMFIWRSIGDELVYGARDADHLRGRVGYGWAGWWLVLACVFGTLAFVAMVWNTMTCVRTALPPTLVTSSSRKSASTFSIIH